MLYINYDNYDIIVHNLLHDYVCACIHDCVYCAVCVCVCARVCVCMCCSLVYNWKEGGRGSCIHVTLSYTCVCISHGNSLNLMTQPSLSSGYCIITFSTYMFVFLLVHVFPFPIPRWYDLITNECVMC